MTTAEEICRRALVRARIYAPEEEPAAHDAADALRQLNDMLFGWEARGVNIGHLELAGSDTFVFFVPPVDTAADVITDLSHRGNWDADANSPALASGSGTRGYTYKVSVAGATVLDDVSAWALNDFALFDGAAWHKGRSSRQFESTVIAMLGLDLCNDHGKEPPPVLTRDAVQGWPRIQSCFVKPKMNATIDTALVNMPSRRFIPDGTILG